MLMMFCCTVMFTQKSLQQDLDALEWWSIKWSMSFNLCITNTPNILQIPLRSGSRIFGRGGGLRNLCIPSHAGIEYIGASENFKNRH